MIRQLRQQQPQLSPDLGRLASEINWHLDEDQLALELARDVAATSDFYPDHVWLAHLLVTIGGSDRESQAKAFDEAEASLRRAIELQRQARELAAQRARSSNPTTPRRPGLR